MHCPRAPTPEPSSKERAPTQEPALLKRKVVRPWCPVFALSWLSAPGLLLGCSFLGQVPACSCLCFCSTFCFFSVGRGRHVPAPGGRDVGSSLFSFRAMSLQPFLSHIWSTRAPTQGPALSGTPPHTSSLCSSARPPCSFPSTSSRQAATDLQE